MKKTKIFPIIFPIIGLFFLILILIVFLFFLEKQSANQISKKSFLGKFSGKTEKCGIEQCHGFNVTCGSNVPEACTEEMTLEDFCRKYLHCEKTENSCQLIEDPNFEECKKCIIGCNELDSPIDAFNCAEGCVVN